MFNEFVQRGKFGKCLNATFIVRMPKKAGAMDLKDFCPISLVGGFYKILVKVLTNRLKLLLKKIISPSQNAFVKGRMILDFVLIANECIDSRMRLNVSGLLCKLDIHKAYDYVNWDFLLCLLRRCGFRDKWCRWIAFFISSVKFSMMVNGSPPGFFDSSCGLIRVTLFVIVMEAPSKMVDELVGRGFINGV